MLVAWQMSLLRSPIHRKTHDIIPADREEDETTSVMSFTLVIPTLAASFSWRHRERVCVADIDVDQLPIYRKVDHLTVIELEDG